MPGIAQWLPWHLLTIQSMCFDCFGWEWELQLMNHTVSFIHSASPLMESIHKCGLIVSTHAHAHTHTHTPPSQPAHTRSQCTHNTRPWRTAIAGPTRPHPPDAPARLICIRDKLERSSAECSSARLARDNNKPLVCCVSGLGFSCTNGVGGVCLCASCKLVNSPLIVPKKKKQLTVFSFCELKFESNISVHPTFIRPTNSITAFHMYEQRGCDRPMGGLEASPDWCAWVQSRLPTVLRCQHMPPKNTYLEENSTFNDKYRNLCINERNWFQFFYFTKKLESLKRVLFCTKYFLKNSLEK